MKFHASLGKAGDQLELEWEAGKVAKLRGVGCPALLNALQHWRPVFQASSNPESWLLPEGSDHASLLMRELILKAQGKWQLPYQDEELCHCRAVPTIDVDLAIARGCHSVKEVGRDTGAGTQCGSCKRDIQNLLDFRLPQKPVEADTGGSGKLPVAK